MMAGAGWSGDLLSRNQDVLTNWERPGASPPVVYAPGFAWDAAGKPRKEGVPGGSPNHEAEAWGAELARAALHGTPQQFAEAKAAVLAGFFPRELAIGPGAIGLWASEQLAPDRHSHQHLAGPSMMRVAAVISGDLELLRLTGQLLRTTCAALQALATPEGWIGTAGLRCKGKPAWWAGSAWLRQVLGREPAMPEYSAEAERDRQVEGKPSLWLDPMSVGIRAIRLLQAHGDDLGGAAEVEPAGCKLKFPVTVYRGEDRHLVIMRRPKANAPRSGVCDWVETPWGLKSFKATVKATRHGTNWQTPPPAPPKGAEVIEFPATWPARRAAA